MENKVTKEGMLAKVRDKKFTVLSDGRNTICELTLENGFVILGHSACADLANFSKEKGEQYAFEDALEKMWPLEGYLLKESLYRAEAKPQRMQVIDGVDVTPQFVDAMDTIVFTLTGHKPITESQLMLEQTVMLAIAMLIAGFGTKHALDFLEVGVDSVKSEEGRAALLAAIGVHEAPEGSKNVH